MIKAIIFDCFGVLVEDSLNAFYAKYLPQDPGKIAHIRLLDRQASGGQITYDEFVAAAAGQANITVSEAHSFLDNNPVNEPLLDYIARNLKQRYKVGFLSNAADDWMDDLFTKDQQALFDDVVLSFQHSIAKPDIEIFRLAAHRLGVAPQECVFIDDVAEYCEGAKAAGMATVQFKTAEQTRADLEALLS